MDFRPKGKNKPLIWLQARSQVLQDLLDCGVILIDKPHGPSSHQLASWARSLLGIKRIGHGGTLDPFATEPAHPSLRKIHQDNLRSTKKTKELHLRNKIPRTYIAQAELSHIVEKLTGEIYNVPPKESAVKVQVRTRKITKSDLIESDEGHRIHLFSMDCEAGTYVRTFVKDLGLMAGNK